jgi:hypothetical protein
VTRVFGGTGTIDHGLPFVDIPLAQEYPFVDIPLAQEALLDWLTDMLTIRLYWNESMGYPNLGTPIPSSF